MNLLNTNANKAVYGGLTSLALAITTILVFYLNGGGEITPTVEDAIAVVLNAIIVAVAVWAVPNKVEPPEPPERVGVEMIELEQ